MVDRIPSVLRRKGRWSVAAAILLFGLVLGGRFIVARSAESPADSVPFDHSIHAGKYAMPCLSCHVDADKSTTAGIPSVRKCMGCHKFVDKEKPGVVELARLWDAGKTPSWQRVYDLPDYVYFSHRVHVGAQVACTQCHGDVRSMTRISRVSSLTMGWCLD